jgi:hypothetical protein
LPTVQPAVASSSWQTLDRFNEGMAMCDGSTQTDGSTGYALFRLSLSIVIRTMFKYLHFIIDINVMLFNDSNCHQNVFKLGIDPDPPALSTDVLTTELSGHGNTT